MHIIVWKRDTYSVQANQCYDFYSFPVFIERKRGGPLVSKFIYLRFFTTLTFYCFHFDRSTLNLKTPKILVVLSFVDE